MPSPYRLLWAAAFVLAACHPDPPAPLRVAEVRLASVPPEDGHAAPPTIVRGACPTACCAYGTWRTTSPTTVYALPGEPASAAFTLPAGATLTAHEGEAHIEEPGLVVATVALTLHTDGPVPIRAQPGDSLLTLASYTDGTVAAWHEGQAVRTDPIAWGYADPAYIAETGPPSARLLRSPLATWWTRITDAAGRPGWIWMDAAPTLEGSTACGR